MKIFRKSIGLILIVTLLVILSACGDNVSSSGQETGTEQTGEQAVTSELSTEEQTIPPADKNAVVDALIGSWKDIGNSERFVTISKLDSGYRYEDNEGQYPAMFAEGVLKIEVADADTADAYINPKTGHMLSIYQGNISEFEKK